MDDDEPPPPIMDEEGRRSSGETIAPLDPESTPLLRPSQIFNQLAFPRQPIQPTSPLFRQAYLFTCTSEDSSHADEQRTLLPHSRHDSAVEVDADKGKRTEGLHRLLTAIRRAAASMILASHQTVALTTKMDLYFTCCFLVFIPLALLSRWMGWGPVVEMLFSALAVGSAAFMASALFEDMVSVMPGSIVHALIADMLFSNAAWLWVGIFALSQKNNQTIAFIIPGSILTRSLLGLGLALISGSFSQRRDDDNASTMALYSSLKITALVPFFLCSLLAFAFRDDDVPPSPNSRDHVLLFSRGSAIISLSCYLLLHIFLNITHTQPVSPTPPTVPNFAAAQRTTATRRAAGPPTHSTTTTTTRVLAFLAAVLATALTSRNLVHALAVLPTSGAATFPASTTTTTTTTTAAASFHAILLPLLINHPELVAAVKAPHLHRHHRQNPHHVLAVLIEAPTVHATLALVPSLVLLGWAFGGRDVGMEIGRGEGGGGKGGGDDGPCPPSGAATALVLLLLCCGLGAWVGGVVVAGRRAGRLMVLKGWVLVSLYLIMAIAVFLLP